MTMTNKIEKMVHDQTNPKQTNEKTLTNEKSFRNLEKKKKKNSGRDENEDGDRRDSNQ